MPCALTSNIALGCNDSVGGLKRIYVTELENKGTLTKLAGLITAFTLVTTKRFWVYDFEKQNAELTEKINPSNENGTVFYEGELKVSLNKRDVAKRNELALLAVNRLLIIAEDRNGIYWLIGEENGANLLPSTSVSGKAMGDRNGYELVFGSMEKTPFAEVTGSLIATLIIPAT